MKASANCSPSKSLCQGSASLKPFQGLWMCLELSLVKQEEHSSRERSCPSQCTLCWSSEAPSLYLTVTEDAPSLVIQDWVSCCPTEAGPGFCRKEVLLLSLLMRSHCTGMPHFSSHFKIKVSSWPCQLCTPLTWESLSLDAHWLCRPFQGQASTPSTHLCKVSGQQLEILCFAEKRN